jgi:hypothetical protein
MDGAALADNEEDPRLPNAAWLIAGLHSLLIHEPNQFFLVHKDSKKDDWMVGTLVTLPSSHVGGELVVGHNEKWKASGGSKSALSLLVSESLPIVVRSAATSLNSIAPSHRAVTPKGSHLPTHTS